MVVINQRQIDRLYPQKSSASSPVVNLGKYKIVSGVVEKGGGGMYLPTGENISIGEIPEAQMKQILQREIEARQRGEAGTQIKGGFLSLYETSPQVTQTQVQQQKQQAIEQAKLKSAQQQQRALDYTKNPLFQNIADMQRKIMEQLEKSNIQGNVYAEKYLISPITQLELKKASEKQEIINKYNQGIKLTFLERQKIDSYLKEQDKIKKDAEDYLKNRKIIKDSLTGESRVEKLSEYLRRTKQSGSITQKYYETIGKLLEKISGGYLTAPKFYVKGEREALIQEGITPILKAGDYSSQQIALEELVKAGGKYEIRGDKLIIDISNIAPTSEIANLIVSSSDIFFKGEFFRPLIQTGAVKKKEQQLTYVRKFESFNKPKTVDIQKLEKLNALTERLRQLSEQQDTQGIKDILFKIAKDINKLQGEQKEKAVNEFVTYLKGLVYNGVLSVPKQQEIIIDITTLGYLPQLEKIPELFSISKMFDPMKELKDKYEVDLLKKIEINNQLPILNIEKIQKELQKQIQETIQRPAQTPSLSQPQIQIPIQPQPQIQPEPQKQTPSLSQPQISQEQQLQRELQRQIQIQYQIQRNINKEIYKMPKLLPIKFRQEEIKGKKKKVLQIQGYSVYGKAIKDGRLFKINNSPVTKSRAYDIGAYYVTQTLARTFVVKKGGRAEEDYEFMFIPQGYYQQVKNQLRDYRIKNKKAVKFDETRMIQKGVYSLSSKAEKRQIQAFRNQVKNILKI